MDAEALSLWGYDNVVSADETHFDSCAREYWFVNVKEDGTTSLIAGHRI